MYPDDIEEAAAFMRAIMRGEIEDARPTLSERMRAAALLVAWHHQGELWRPLALEEDDAISRAIEAYENEKSASCTPDPDRTGFNDLDADASGGWGSPQI